MRFWISTVSRAHVQNGIAGGFAEDDESRLKRLSPGDRIVFYAPRPDQRFTAIAEVVDGGPYQSGEVWRRNVIFRDGNELAVQPLIDALDFIRDKRSWGVFFRRGFFEINESDFRTLERGFGTAVTVGAAKAG